MHSALPLRKWHLSHMYCCQADLPGQGQGMFVFTQTRRELIPSGRIATFASLRGAPVHLTPDMLFLRGDTGAADGVQVRLHGGALVVVACHCLCVLALIALLLLVC